MKVSEYKRQDYKFLPMDKLREICIFKKKQVSYSSYILVIISALAFVYCGIIGWVTIFTTLYAGVNYMTPAYFFTILFSIAFLIFGGGVRSESKLCVWICIVLFCLMFIVGFMILCMYSNTNEFVTAILFMFIGLTGTYCYFKLFSCFEDINELRKLDGFPKFIEYAITKDDFEKRIR